MSSRDKQLTEGHLKRQLIVTSIQIFTCVVFYISIFLVFFEKKENEKDGIGLEGLIIWQGDFAIANFCMLILFQGRKKMMESNCPCLRVLRFFLSFELYARTFRSRKKDKAQKKGKLTIVSCVSTSAVV